MVSETTGIAPLNLKPYHSNRFRHLSSNYSLLCRSSFLQVRIIVQTFSYQLSPDLKILNAPGLLVNDRRFLVTVPRSVVREGEINLLQVVEDLVR